MTFERIDIARAESLIAEDGALMIDIRDAQSYSSGRIPGALRVSGETLQAFLDDTDRATPLIVCCYHGNMSQGAADYLSSAGFSKCFSLDGGFHAWQQSGHRIEAD